MIWNVSIDLVSIWHWLLIGMVLFFGFLGSFWNLEGKKSPIPMFFAIIVALILFGYAPYLEPILFGFMRYAMYSAEWLITVYFGIVFLILFIEIWYNNAVNGTVIE